ncbi:MAG TPA: winged helix-turn-helix domain-containing protein [Kofleriaceae bacterium]|nr:winged helix-turn-helix domain-containing protein [Kofleriaceae bacterium]
MASSSRSRREPIPDDRPGSPRSRSVLKASAETWAQLPDHDLAASPLFVGREEEIGRAARGLREVGLATIVGMAGVGKSALAQRIASAWPGPVLRHHVRAGQPVAELLDDLRRGCAGDDQRTPELRSDGERLADAARLLDHTAAMVVLEDADRMGDAAADMLTRLAASVRRGRVVVTSRTRLYGGAGPERVEIVLGGLDAGAARELWALLDDRYGTRAGFEQAWERTGGNPFHLRRAHEGDLDVDDPIVATVAALDADERRVALALALVGMPLAREVAARLLPVRGRAAIAGLIAKLVVETTWCGELLVHDLIGDGLRAAASAGDLAAAHRALADALEGAPLGLIAGTRLRVRHMAAAGMVRPARDLLLARARELVRGGGAGELLRGLDLVTGDGDGEARLARARAMARMLDLDRAYDEVLALGGDRPDAGDQLRATFAHLAMLTLRLDVAGRVSRAGLMSPSTPPELRVRFATVHVLTATYQGEGRAAREQMERAAAGFPTPLVRGYAALARAFSFWLEERDADAERAMRAPWPLLRGALALRAGVLAPTFMVSVLARAGKTGDAAAALSEAEAALARFDDPLMRLSLRALRITLLESQGDFRAAREEACAVEDALASAGHRLGVLWIRLVRARLMLWCGQVRAGRRLLDEVTREASGAGATLIVRLATRAERADPWTAVTSPRRGDSSRPGEERRERAIALLRAVGAGQVPVARGYAAAIDRAAADPIELALVALADCALDEGGDAPAPAPCDDGRLAAATAEAARAGADPELIPAIAAWLRDRLAARPRGPVRLVVVDRHSDTVRSDSLVVQLGRRPALRRLLYAMLEAPGRPHDRSALARAIWAVDYRAVHDGALWVNVKRLRALLAPTGLQVATDEEGVRLCLEPGCELQVIAR